MPPYVRKPPNLRAFMLEEFEAPQKHQDSCNLEEEGSFAVRQ